MAAGLIQLALYGAQDLFLTGVPEITYFKVVYRRHTSFASESILSSFEDTVSFDNINVAKIEKIGDLMHKSYLQITLPQINLQRQTLPDPTDFQIAFNTAQANYNTILQFMGVNRVAYVNANNIFIAENNVENATGDMINTINSVFANQGDIVMATQQLLASDPNAPFTYNEISMEAIASEFDANSDKTDLFTALSVGIDKSIKTQGYYYNVMFSAQTALNDATNPNIKFAWVDRIGHAITEYIEVRIGGHIIDKQFDSWLNVWYELSANRSMERTYFELIGNVPELTTFDRNVKPQYILRIPLQFWFCRFSGLAIPLVALEYHNVSFHVKFRRFDELCYIEEGNSVKFSLAENGLTLEEVPDTISGVNIDAQMMIDYYYLDSPERRRFAQSSHEYLIEQLQFLSEPNVTQQSIQILLSNFVHPTQEVIWVSQKQKYRVNVDGFNQCRWDNYSISDANVGNPIATSSINFNSLVRVAAYDGNYFNYVQPYQTHNTTPSDGINIYTFAIFPEEFQPSGTANFSRISRIILNISFISSIIANNVITDPVIVFVFTRNLNILRIINGFGALAFVYG